MRGQNSTYEREVAFDELAEVIDDSGPLRVFRWTYFEKLNTSPPEVTRILEAEAAKLPDDAEETGDEARP